MGNKSKNTKGKWSRVRNVLASRLPRSFNTAFVGLRQPRAIEEGVPYRLLWNSSKAGPRVGHFDKEE